MKGHPKYFFCFESPKGDAGDMEVKSKLDERFKDVKNCYEIGI